MTPDAFRKLALALPEAVESSHMAHPDFRVRGKIFATLTPDGRSGMAKLTPAQQAEFLAEDRDTFEPASGAWGRRGATLVMLRRAREATVRHALLAAWTNVAPRKLAREFLGGP